MKKRWFASATPESVGISSVGVQKLIDTMCFYEPGRETHGFMIIRNRKIVAEGSFAPFTDDPHVIHSCTKAFTATAIGFAQQEGLLHVDDPIMNYLSDLAPAEHAPELDRLTIRHLLTMSNGHAVNVFRRPCHEISPAELKRNFMAAPFGCEPGSKFAYNNTNSYMMAEIIRRLTGKDPMDYLRPRLLNKLGIEPSYQTDTDGMFMGYGHMRLTREELARFGQFYMDGCVWEGERLLPEAWAKEATGFQIATTSLGGTPGKNPDWDAGYAFHMWRGQHDGFRFCGAYGQICACYPKYNLMFCLNSGSTQEVQEMLTAFYEYILLPLQENLPENPEALVELRRRCETLALPSVFSAPSPMVPRITGKTWALENCGNVTAATLDFTEDICRIRLDFHNGGNFTFDAGLKAIAKTDCPNTHVVALQPRDEAICAASAAWTQLNELQVTARMLPTHTMFYLKFTFTADGCTLEPTMHRAYPFGTVG